MVAAPHQTQFARILRKNMTDAEQLLWRHLRAHRLCGQKFRRQQPVGPYIVDFVHFGARLVIEADGGQHNGNPDDAARDAWLRNRGFTVLRFWNDEILLNVEVVLEVILGELAKGAASFPLFPLSPCPSPSRERGDR
ncbi:endonuclease domain-containing protein [Paraburkholderia silviterrae]|uniref:Endonuclease domain-containing protein n=1 Tax=Paraburkholderia silviterrae TaxID=2528715 RepID=A0A4R5M8R8_9BURK|nr:endonuclease domain-containing protein [Paraburkholderia silviterrae]TDG22890.1 endonuclease domain-containing protein [Paraburkholderia silviterrae]